MEYKLIVNKNAQEFAMWVSEALSDKWELYGPLIADGEVLIREMTRKEKKKTGVKKFIKPTGEELNQFARESNLTLKGFYDYYESKGWKVGQSPMKDWKSAARGWNKRSFGDEKQVANKGAATKAFDFTEIDGRAAKKSDPAKVRKMLADNKKREIFKSVGQLPPNKENNND